MQSWSGLKSVFLLMVSALSFSAVSQEKVSEFPSKPVKIIVTFTPGGAADVTRRSLEARGDCREQGRCGWLHWCRVCVPFTSRRLHLAAGDQHAHHQPSLDPQIGF